MNYQRQIRIAYNAVVSYQVPFSCNNNPLILIEDAGAGGRVDVIEVYIVK
jgi:hypothetical protein